MHPSRHRQVSVYVLSALRPGDGQRSKDRGEGRRHRRDFKEDGMHLAKANGSRIKRSQKNDLDAKDDTNMPKYGKKADNSNLESALMKKNNSANLKQKLARTI